MPKGRTILLEDVTTTGGSLINALNQLLQANVLVAAAISLTNRNELRDDNLSVKEMVEKSGVPYYAMSNLSEILEKAFQRFKPAPAIKQSVESYFKKYGDQSFKFL